MGRTMPTSAWSLKRTNVQLDYKEVQNEVKAIAAVVSREYGLEHIEVFRNSITKINFRVFLEGLRRLHPFDDILLVMDQLNLHRSRETKDLLDEMGFLYAYTPVKSPRYNGIEEVFNMAKQKVKNQRLR